MLTPGLGEGPREVLEQAGAVPGVDLELDPVGGRVVALPGDVGEPLRRLPQRVTFLQSSRWIVIPRPSET